MLAGNGLHVQPAQAVFEPPGEGPEVDQKLPTPRAVQDLQGGLSGLGLTRGDGVGVDIEGSRLPQEPDEGSVGGHITSVDPEGLPQGAHQNVDLRSGGEFFGATARLPESTYPVGVVHDHHHVLRIVIVVLSGQCHDLVHGGMVTPHAEDSIGDDQGPIHLPLELDQRFLQGSHVQVGVDRLLFGPGETGRIDDAVVVQRVADEGRFFGDQGSDGSHDGRISRGEDHGALPAVEGGQLSLQLRVHVVGAADEANGAGPGPVTGGAFLFGLHDFRSERHAQIGVGVHPQELFFALSRQMEAGTSVAGRLDGIGDHQFGALGCALLFQVRHVVPKDFRQSM